MHKTDDSMHGSVAWTTKWLNIYICITIAELLIKVKFLYKPRDIRY